ncbi:MAG TPA: putative urea ABC transporter substrate-binding protein [Candidatus Acidoferrum sp.]|nr:putative urea ABC transporter substrate-binding protein [Candidatus Acidoferrum sp.]
MRGFLRRALGACAIVAVLAGAIASSPRAEAEAKKSFRVAWSIYVGWMPWAYAAETGIMKKWADKYGITVELVQVKDYVDSMNQYTAGAFDGCAMTNMDALTLPAAGGVDTSAVIIGDFSNGNDGVILKSGPSLADLRGRRIGLVQFSVSHYLLARALETAGLSERDVTIVNTSDSDIVNTFAATPDMNAVVTWNPQLAAVLKMPGVNLVFDSSMIRGEIIDLMAVNTQTLRDNPDLGKALVGAWYEALATMLRKDEVGAAALDFMAKASGTDIAGYKAQLDATRLFSDPQSAIAFAMSADLPTTMNRVRRFSFAHGLLGNGAASADAVGVQMPDSQVLGDAGNVKLRFDTTYMALAADGKL